MKVLHVPYGYYPDPVGGTEVYVQSLCRALQARELDVTIAAPGSANDAYVHAGIQVRRFGIAPHLDLRSQYGAGDAVAAANFGRVLDLERPDIVHLHAYTSAVSLLTVEQIKRRELPVVFTYHTPAVTCLRGNLLRWGAEVCSGDLGVEPCSACVLQLREVPRPAANVLGSMPVQLATVIGRVPLSQRTVTALRSAELVDVHHRALRGMLGAVDRVVVLCDWAKELLIRNGVAAERISLSRHGIDSAMASNTSHRPLDKGRGQQLRLAFIGRIDPIKGLDVLIRAIRSEVSLDVRLDVYGVAQAASGPRHLEEVQELASGDARIVFRDPVPSQQVVEVLRGYDALAVPSQCLETGPLVILEAFAAGLPVVGSDLGGIRELATNDRDGLLVNPPTQASAWGRALQRLATDPNLRTRLRSGVRPPRTIQDVAADMSQLYVELTRKPSPSETVVRG